VDFMIEKDSFEGVAIGFAVIDRDPVSIEFCGGVGRAGIKWRLLVLRDACTFP